MKKIFVLLVLSLAAAVGIGRFNLGESGGMRFLTKMEALMSEGNASAVCAMFHEDLQVEVADHAGESPQLMSGGKSELCAITHATVKGLQSVPHSMQVEYSDVNATQKFSSPWTGELTYSEHRTFSIRGANISLRTVSRDRITLVQTVAGVKLLKLESEIYRADAT